MPDPATALAERLAAVRLRADHLDLSARIDHALPALERLIAADTGST